MRFPPVKYAKKQRKKWKKTIIDHEKEKNLP